ncbi:hypothetical protein SLS62_009424 [Diatrype stigma]|uniref:Uncharacterized protein n=1 Tax=Diatrype stigma TaxID=117547 RepID=A0AAN9YIG2_9PEZI
MADNQLWFFLREDMTISQFVQVPLTFDEVQKVGITLDYCMNATQTTGPIKDQAFYIHSASMAAAVRLLDDDSIIATYNMYCQKDPVVTISIRKASDPSPNTSISASHQSSLAERRNISARRGLLAPELFIQPRTRHVSGSSDIITGDTIVDENTMVTLRVEKDFVTFTQDYLIGKEGLHYLLDIMTYTSIGWITAQLADLRPLTDICVQHYTTNGTLMEVQLTADIWQHSLIRGPWKNSFAPIWNEYHRQQCAREDTLETIAARDPKFRQNCKNFIYDLRTFGYNKRAQARLDKTGHEFYMGSPYFNEDVRAQLLDLPVSRVGTLDQVLRALAMKRAGSTICASHDLAPIFESALGIV